MNPVYPATPGAYPATSPPFPPSGGSATHTPPGLGFNHNVIPQGSSYPYTAASAGKYCTYIPGVQSSLHQPLYKHSAPTYSQVSSPGGAPPPYTPTATYSYQPPTLVGPHYAAPQPTYPSSVSQYTPQYNPSPVIHHTTVVQQPVRTVYGQESPYEGSHMAGGMSASSALSMVAMQRPGGYSSPYHPNPYQPRLGYHWW
ncbi:uncharacterized protein LOC100376788 isoform X1 [Saccoglossus kowalevskii]